MFKNFFYKKKGFTFASLNLTQTNMATVSNKKSVDKVGGCAFCSQGVMTNGHLVYPYENEGIHELRSSGRGNVVVPICPDCLVDIAKFVKANADVEFAKNNPVLAKRINEIEDNIEDIKKTPALAKKMNDSLMDLHSLMDLQNLLK